jgi:hypothetical protein
VAVYIRSGFRDHEIQRTPRLTLALLLTFGGIFALVTRLTDRSRRADGA